MLISGIALTILGFIVFQWVVNVQSKSILERPIVFNNAVAVSIINLLSFALLAGGFYSLWQVNPIIVLALIGIYAVLWIFGYFSWGSEKAKAKKILNIYKQLKLFHPKATNQELFRETARTYFSNAQWGEYKIEAAMDAIFENRHGIEEYKDIKSVASSILIFDDPHSSWRHSFNFEKYIKRHTKREKAIDDAYNAVFGKMQKITERPILSKGIQNWAKEIGLNPDEMSNEQLAAFAEFDDIGKSHWLVKFLYIISFGFLALAGLSLLSLKLVSVLFYGAVSFAIWFVGYKIHIRIINKKFYEASIMKYAQEQVEKTNH